MCSNNEIVAHSLLASKYSDHFIKAKQECQGTNHDFEQFEPCAYFTIKSLVVGDQSVQPQCCGTTDPSPKTFSAGNMVKSYLVL